MTAIPKTEDMPLRGLPTNIAEDALSSVAIALFGKDMATAAQGGRLVAGHEAPAFVLTTRFSIDGRMHKMTLTVQVEATDTSGGKP